PVVVANEETRDPRSGGIGRKRQYRPGDIVSREGAAMFSDIGYDLADRDRARTRASAPALRLGDAKEEQRDNEAGQPDNKEDELPGTNRTYERQDIFRPPRSEADYDAAKHEGKPRADIDAHAVDAERGSAALRREVIYDQRMRRWIE